MTPKSNRRDPQQLSLFQEKTVDVRFVTQYLGTSGQTVLRLIQEGKLRAYRLTERGWWRVFYASVVEYESGLKEEYGIASDSAKMATSKQR